jgi:hypothetical protein
MTGFASTSGSSDRAEPWAPYSPTDDAPWDLRRVVHLHRRAGFAASWDEIQRDLRQGPAASVGRLLEGRARSAQAPAEYEPLAAVLSDAAAGSTEPNRLKAS